MVIGEVHEEPFDEMEFHWSRLLLNKTVETTVTQVQGCDLFIAQKRGKKECSLDFYSDPGFALFAALLNYHRSLYRELPYLREIQHIQRIASGTRHQTDEGDLELLIAKAEGSIPQRQGNVVYSQNPPHHMVVGQYMGGVPYFGFRDGDCFTIAMPVQERPEVEIHFMTPTGATVEKYPCKRKIRLEPDDALRVLKAIYFFASNKDLLDRLYERVKEQTQS